jgi:protein phosphatase
MVIKPKIDVAALSDVGCIRTNNEDSFRYLAEGDDFWAAVADGCGGEAAGEVASRIAIEIFAEDVAAQRASGRDVPFILRDAVVKANRAILEAATVEGRRGMGTTLSVFFVRGRNAFVAHAGDSRIYRRRGDAFEQLTVDHTWVHEQVLRGTIKPEDEENHPQSGILLKALGTVDFTAPDIEFLDAVVGDTILLSSDGLHRVVPVEEIREHMTLSPREAAQQLLNLALKRGSPDNVSLIVMRIEGFERREEGTMMDATPVEGTILDLEPVK